MVEPHNAFTSRNHFHLSVQETILFSAWHTTTWTEMLGSCMGVAVLALLYEGLKVLREFVDIKLMKVHDMVDIRHRTDDSGCHTPSTEGSKTTVTTPQHDVLGFRRRLGVLRPAHWLQTLLHFIQLFISLSLMLVFMTFNVYLCLAVTVGGAMGYFSFAWIRPTPATAQRYDSDMYYIN